MQADNMIMLTIGCITLSLAGMIVWDLWTRDSFTYKDGGDDETS